MSIVGITFGSTANPQAIFAPSDYQGRLCGIDAGVANKPYGYVVNLNLDIVCVNFCPSVTKSVDGNNNAYDQMICKSEDVKDSYKGKCRCFCAGCSAPLLTNHTHHCLLSVIPLTCSYLFCLDATFADDPTK